MHDPKPFVRIIASIFMRDNGFWFPFLDYVWLGYQGNIIFIKFTGPASFLPYSFGQIATKPRLKAMGNRFTSQWKEFGAIL
jgi:hypothetical protein